MTTITFKITKLSLQTEWIKQRVGRQGGQEWGKVVGRAFKVRNLTGLHRVRGCNGLSLYILRRFLKALRQQFDLEASVLVLLKICIHKMIHSPSSLPPSPFLFSLY